MLTSLCWVLLLCGAGAELLVTLTPEIVEPDVTPFFTIRCSLVEQEEGNIAALALYRRSITAKNGNTSPELIAEILGTYPAQPSPVPGFERLTVHGQISQLEAELETFLEVVWPNPSLRDLGLYFCEATVLGEAGGTTTVVEARVTTSNAVTDRLLATVAELEERVRGFNTSLQEIQIEIENITTVLSTETIISALESADQKRVEETTEAVPTATTRGLDKPEEVTLSEEPEKDETLDEAATAQTSDLNRIADGLEDLRDKLDNINQTLGRINDVIASLSDRVPTVPEVILAYFESDNSSYFLFKSTNNTDTRSAQVVCESKELYLAEITDEGQLLSISDEVSRILEINDVLLIGGAKEYGQEHFIFQNSQELVQFFPGDFPRNAEHTNGACLALTGYASGLTFTLVPCSSDGEIYHYFLCQRAQF
ncbi:hypothetical protein BsWGS_16182 [Bradybaena similaris]